MKLNFYFWLCQQLSFTGQIIVVTQGSRLDNQSGLHLDDLLDQIKVSLKDLPCAN